MALIHQKLVEIMRELRAISKEQKNTFDGYMFRGIDDVLNNLHGPFAKHGVVLLPKVLHRDDYEGKTKKGDATVRIVLTVEYSFICAEDGSIEKAVVLGEGVDRSDKAVNKAMSAALKYLLIQVLLIPVKDMEDADKASPELPEPKQVKTKEQDGKYDPASYFEGPMEPDWEEPLPDFAEGKADEDGNDADTRAKGPNQKINKTQIEELLRMQAAKGLPIATMRKLVKQAGATEAKELTVRQYFYVVDAMSRMSEAGSEASV